MKDVIDFGIINYNGGDYLEKCIRSIKKMEGVNCRIFILDNASSDSSAVSVEEEFPDCSVIYSEKNLGYAGGCNRLLTHLKSDIVVLCNMDLEFAADWGLRTLECFESHPEASSAGSMVLDKQSGSIYSSGVFFYWDLFPLCSNDKPATEDCYEVFGSYGAVMAFRREVFEKIGMFDNDYFLFFEETEFYWRMNINKLKTIFNPQARVFHHRSVSTIKYSPLKLYYSERNRVWTAFKYMPLWYFPLTFPISLARFFLMARRGIPGADGKGNSVHKAVVIAVLFKAWFAALIGLGREWKKRRQLWKGTVLSTMDTLRLICKYKLSNSELKIK